jgi:peptidyl-prolyl cis-trans isomerase C
MTKIKLPYIRKRSWLIFLLAISLVACDKPLEKHLKKDPYKKLFKKKGKTAYAKLPYQVMSRVNMDSINENTYTLYLKTKYGNNPPKDKTRQESLNELVNLYLLAQKARQLGYHKNPNVRDRIQFMTQSILARLYLEEVTKNVKVTEKDLRAAYQKEYLHKQNIEYKTRHILFNSRKQAVAIMRQLAQGADFSELAKLHSRGPSRSFGGALEWFRTDAVAKPFAKAVISMRVGETSRFPVKTEHGWHIILLEEKRNVEPPKFEEVKHQLYQSLKAKRIQSSIDKLRKYSNITLTTDSE